MESHSHTDDASASLRSNWKFPAVVHFCRVFEGVLSLRQFSSDKFEAALLNPGDHSVFLSELISRLLYPGRKKNVAKPETTWPTWESNLLKKVKTHWALTMDHDPLEKQQHFVEVSSSEKLEILYLLTEIALLNSASLRDTIRNTVEDPYLTADSVRCLPIGEDANGDKYYLFSLRYEDCRLYKQLRSQLKDEASSDHQCRDPEWSTVTTTLEELRSFVSALYRSKHPAEKKLHRYLVGILPEFERTERHRKKVEDRAALREQAPLLKRSSRLQEQVKRKEKARGQIRTTKDTEMRETKGEDGTGEDGHTTCFDLGISREERMRLRNQRRELAEKGLRRVLTGKKRVLEYDGLTPLGASVQCPRKKRIQEVRPSRNITKLVSIIWEKFRSPMNHRKQFDIHMEASNKRRAAYLQGRNELMSRLRLPTRPPEGCMTASARLPMPLSLTQQESYRQAPVQQPSVLMSLLQQQQQRPVRSSYNLNMLQMPRPLQSTTDFVAQQQQHEPALAPSLQPHVLRYGHPQTRDVPPAYAMGQRPVATSDTLRRHLMSQQPKQHFDLRTRQPPLLPQAQAEQVQRHAEMQSMQRNPAAIFPSTFMQHRMGEPAYIRSPGNFSVPDGARVIRPPLNGLPGYPASLGHAQSQLMTNHRLTPSLVQYPVPMQAMVKPNWNNPVSGDGVNGNAELPKMPFANPPYLPQGQPSMRAHADRATLNPRFQLDSRWQPHTQIHDNSNGAPGQDPNGMFQQLFLRKRSE